MQRCPRRNNPVLPLNLDVKVAQSGGMRCFAGNELFSLANLGLVLQAVDAPGHAGRAGFDEGFTRWAAEPGEGKPVCGGAADGMKGNGP